MSAACIYVIAHIPNAQYTEHFGKVLCTKLSYINDFLIKTAKEPQRRIYAVLAEMKRG